MCLKNVNIYIYLLVIYNCQSFSPFRRIFLGSPIVISPFLGEHGFWAREASCLRHPSPCGAAPAGALSVEQGSLFLRTMLEVLCHSLLLRISFWLALSIDMSAPSAWSPLNWPGLHLPVSDQWLLLWSTMFLTDIPRIVLFPLSGGRLLSVALISCPTHIINFFFVTFYIYNRESLSILLFKIWPLFLEHEFPRKNWENWSVI